MNPRLSRRGALELLGAGALVTLATPIVRARGAEAPRITPPQTPMHLSYRVQRELAGGAQLTARRDFEVSFVPLAQGFHVEGKQVSNAIDAPPELAPLAEVWRRTVQSGLFPFTIDADGLVIPGSGPASAPVPELYEGIDTGLDMLRKDGKSAAAIADARTFGLWLQRAAAEASSDIPRDLLVPPAGIQQVSKTIALPGGKSGDNRDKLPRHGLA